MSARLRLRPENVALTHGGTAAVVLVQRSAVSAGGTIAAESPSHRLLLPVMRRWGMRSLEIPTRPRGGLSIDVLDFAARAWRRWAPSVASR